jgi:sarcosine oxidase, subunit gamma
MSDVILSRRAPVVASPLVSEGFALRCSTDGEVLHVLASWRDKDCIERLKAFSSGRDHVVRPLGPGQWLMVFAEPLTDEDRRKLQAAAGGAAVVDQTHGRVRMIAEGQHVERVLCKGTAVNIDMDAFPVGASAVTLFGHIAAQVTRTAARRFELIVLRGFAESLWEELTSMAMEFTKH